MSSGGDAFGEGRTARWLVTYSLAAVGLLGARALTLDREAGSVLYLAAVALAAVALWIGPRLDGTPVARPWTLLAVGVSLVLAAVALWVWEYAWDGSHLEVHDWLNTAGYVFVIAALVDLVRHRVPNHDAASVLDAAIIGVAGAAVLWELWFEDATVASAGSPAFGAVWMLADLMMVVLAIQLVVRGPFNLSLVLLAAGAVTMSAGHVALFAVERGPDGYEPWFDLIWMLGFCLAGAAALAPGASTIAGPLEERRLDAYPRARLAVIGLSLAMPAALVGAGTLSESESLVPALGLGVLVTLVTVRIAGLVDEHAAARRELDARELADRIKATTDGLTQLPNRVACMRRLQAAVAADGDGEPLAVGLLDLDRFKLMNDSLGHDAGDAVLREAARRIESAMRTIDTVARFDGDEFCLLFAGVADDHAALTAADRVLEALHEPMTVDGRTLNLTGTMGITRPRSGDTVRVVLRRADAALRAGKAAGRGLAVAYEPSMPLDDEDRLRLRHQASDALTNGELRLWFQPQVAYPAATTTGVEALLRWHHPERGLIGPADLLEVAEDSGLVEPIGDWVLATALEQAARWQHLYGTGAPRVSINVSPTQMRRADVAGWVTGRVAELGLDARGLCFEVTETAVMGEPGVVCDQLQRLRDLGADVALDDFGTGYSSLTDLRDLHVSEIKIDTSFVRHLPTSLRDRGIVDAIVSLARTLGCSVMAEGVETTDQEREVIALGCDGAQGYLYSAAVPPEEIERRLELELGEAPWAR